MAIKIIKGHKINEISIKTNHNRRALQYHNKIIATLGKLGLHEDYIDVKFEALAIRKAAASVTWYMEGYKLYYSYNSANKFVDNIYMVSQVIAAEVEDVLSGEKTIEEFLRDFSEDDDVETERKAARETLGLSHEEIDMDIINKKYKDMARDMHPDMPNGCLETFKRINKAHKVLKRELA